MPLISVYSDVGEKWVWTKMPIITVLCTALLCTGTNKIIVDQEQSVRAGELG